jgi:hypothetical protein
LAETKRIPEGIIPNAKTSIGMKLPRAELAIIPERKITHYLLNPAHPSGGSRAQFFLRFGFIVPDWKRLAEALLQHARENEVVQTERTIHGTRFVVDWSAKSA